MTTPLSIGDGWTADYFPHGPLIRTQFVELREYVADKRVDSVEFQQNAGVSNDGVVS